MLLCHKPADNTPSPDQNCGGRFQVPPYLTQSLSTRTVLLKSRKPRSVVVRGNLSLRDSPAMVFSKVDFLHDAETFLADARDFDEDDLAGRMDLLRKLELLKQRLERPMDKMMNQWITVWISSSSQVVSDPVS